MFHLQVKPSRQIYLNFLLKISPKDNKSYAAYKTFNFSKCSDFVGNTQFKLHVPEIQVIYKIFL